MINTLCYCSKRCLTFRIFPNNLSFCFLHCNYNDNDKSQQTTTKKADALKLKSLFYIIFKETYC